MALSKPTLLTLQESNENAKETEQAGSLEEEKVGNVHSKEKIRRKQKHIVMKEKKILVIERALLDEPEMQKKFL
uniref:Uncharacterized protein n=1 Tax=Cucumis melo TaxID=3656 RepID=A0A9I9E6G3_CUCME